MFKLTGVPVNIHRGQSLGALCVGDPVPVSVPASVPLKVEQLAVVGLNSAPEGAMINRANVVNVGVDVMGPRGVVDASLDKLPRGQR